MSLPPRKDKAMRDMRKRSFDIKTTQVSHDIIERDDSTLPLVDLYTAGPPCQPFSLEGQRGYLGRSWCSIIARVAVHMPQTADNIDPGGRLGPPIKPHKYMYFIVHTLQLMKDTSGVAFAR